MLQSFSKMIALCTAHLPHRLFEIKFKGIASAKTLALQFIRLSSAERQNGQ